MRYHIQAAAALVRCSARLEEVLQAGTDLGMHLAHVRAVAHGQHQLQHALQDVGHCGRRLGPVGVHLQQARLGASSSRRR